MTAESHVAIRLRRVFQRAANEYGIIRLTDTEEVCRDLVWFMERFPMKVDFEDYLYRRADDFDKRTASYVKILEGKIRPKDFNLAVPLREYQAVAASLAFTSRGLLVADDVGLGKTAVSIGLLTRRGTLPALVVTLTHLPYQWVNEIKKFAPELSTHIIKSGKLYDIETEGIMPDVTIINYHKLSSWAETLSPVIKTVVYDECQELRRDKSYKASAAKHISMNTDFRLGLSATPIYNYGGEMYSVIDKLRPGELGSWSEFVTEWCVGSYDKTRVRDPKAFGSYLREQGIMIRRTRAEVGRELPPVQKVPHHVESDEKALDAVSNDLAELARLVINNEAKPFERMKASSDLDYRLRQVTGIAKAPYVADFVRLILETGEKVVLYGWHREVYRIWQEKLRQYNPVLYTGTEGPKAKRLAFEEFTNGDSKVLLISLRAGAGLDGLQTAAHIAVFGELDWSPGVHEQNEGRLARDGQPLPVVAYYLIANDGSDPVVADTLGLKRSQIHGIRDPEKELLEQQKDQEAIRKMATEYLRQRGEGNA